MSVDLRRVMVVGGAGYVGCVLVPKLLNAGHEVVVYDSMMFGSDGLPDHESLTVIEGDVRDVARYADAVRGCDAVVHLACIANDPSFELNPGLSRQINYDSFEPIVVASKKAGVQRFVYASTSSVYGVSDAPEVTENHPLLPITEYNKYKGLSEPLLLQHGSPDFVPVVIRPATVCGYSSRTRLDLTVNILTNHAVNNRRITVFGGDQKRPNIHVDDISELYVALLSYPAELIGGEVFNAGYENFTVMQLAEQVRAVVEQEMPELAPIELVVTPSDDQRSYHVSSRKLRDSLGWEPRRTIEDAVRDLCAAFKAGKLPNSFDDDIYYNVRTTKTLVNA